MVKTKKKREKLYGPVLIITILIVVVAFLSLIFKILGVESYKTVIASNTLETTLVTVKNLISIDGLRFIIQKSVSNFRLFEPLVLLIISLIGIGICEKSGFLSALFSPLKRVKLSIIIFITVLLGIISSVFGDYSYIFLIPLVAEMFKYLGKSSILGIMVIYLGITLGYGTGLVFNYTDYSLALLTENAAKVDIDKNFGFSVFSYSYIMLISTVIMTFLTTLVINKFLVPKIDKKYSLQEEEPVISKKARRQTLFIGLLYILITVYSILPIHLPGAGILLDNDAPRYLEKLFGDGSPFGSGLVLIITLLFILCGYFYGKKSGNIKNSHDFTLGLSKNFENLGIMFVLMFFISELEAIIEWTNLGVVISAKLVEFMGKLQFSGILLIIVLFVVVLLMSFLMPGTKEKWEIASPTIVPLFMQSNITPSFTQFLFKVADGVGKAITPIYSYYIIMLSFLEKYRKDDSKKISVFGVLKTMLPVILIVGFIWILLLSLWYVMGLPIGKGTFPTL